MSSGRKPGVPNKTSLLATADMDRLGINPIEMLKKVFDEAMNSYYEGGKSPDAKIDPSAQYLSIARAAASDLASYKHPKLSAVAFKDLSNPGDAAKPATTQEAMKILKQDPFAIKTEEVVKQIDSTIQTPALPVGEK